tara:strand:+ start:10843 stop:11952 length:1110 start_codon:yes stop_codon:yes gene_type:complete
MNINFFGCFFIIFNIATTLKVVTKPNKNFYQNNGNFFWKIGKSKQFQNTKLHRTLFNNYPICVYRDNENKLNAISDICIHRGAALSFGKLLKNNCIQCPYHGWEYNNGIVQNIPGCPDIKNKFGVPFFNITEINDDVFLCPSFDINSQSGAPALNIPFIPPEANDKNFVRIHGKKHIKRPHHLITENVLDMMHISYVHAFGNQLSPIPFEIRYEETGNFSGRTTFYYTSGPTSMSSIIGGVKEVKVENEFYLPDTTVTRVYAGKIIKTIVTHCYPIGKNESILHFDLYRNFLQFPVFDLVFYNQMDITLKEDIGIINNIYDNHIRGFMNTKYDITQLKFREKWNKHSFNENNKIKKNKESNICNNCNKN